MYGNGKDTTATPLMGTSHLGLQDWMKIFIYPFTIHVTKYPAIQWFQSCIDHNI